MYTRFNLDVGEFTKLKQHFKHKKCFYPCCEQNTIRAHSIQMNGPLRLICDDIGSQSLQVYFLDDDFQYIPKEQIIGSHQNEYKKLRNRGIAEASTFQGFCEEHDKIFKDTIEDAAFVGSEEQQFLFMYRAFAYMMHHNIAGNKGAGSVLNLSKEMLQDSSKVLDEVPKGDKHIDSMMDGLNQALNSLGAKMGDITELLPVELSELDASIKFKLDSILENKSFDEVNFLCRSFDGIFPWACSTVVSYLHPDRIPSEDGIAYSNYYAITVLPDKESVRTHIMIGALNETPNAIPQMNSFRSMSSSNFRKMISNLIIQRGVNTYFSPRLVDSNHKEDFQKLIKARIERFNYKDELDVVNYDINLFSGKFLEH